MIRLEAGASLPPKLLRDHRILAVLAGSIMLGDQPIRERNAVFGSPGDQIAQITATEPSLLWLVRWLWKDNPVADFWLDLEEAAGRVPDFGRARLEQKRPALGFWNCGRCSSHSQFSLSKMPAAPCPPPMHIVTMP